MSKSPFYAYILLDRSGSMENCRDSTIDAVNEYIMGLRRSDTVDARLTLTTFDSQGIDCLQHAEPARSFMEVSRQTFVPRAMTPLLDAIGHAVAAIDLVTPRPEEKISLVILTDGLENASKEHTLESVRALLKDRQDNKGWLVTFLAAEIDAFAQASAIGVDADKYLALKKGKLRSAMRHATSSQMRYIDTGDLTSANFTSAEKDDANTD